MDTLIYGLCALTALVTAALLLRAYARTRLRLLFWSGLCFVGLTANNLLLVADKVLLPHIDLSLPRVLTSLVSMAVLLWGLIVEEEA
jgi:tRNA A-37 threonylcarbamoyl transferase component Bud32